MVLVTHLTAVLHDGFLLNAWSESKSLCNWRSIGRSVSQSVLASNLFWDLWPDFLSVVRLLRL